MADYASVAVSPAKPAELARWNAPASIVPLGAAILGSTASETTYFMRAKRNPGPGYVTWSSVGAADAEGLRAPTPIIPGTAAIQARV